MKSILILVMFSLCLPAAAQAQKRKRAPSRPKSTAKKSDSDAGAPPTVAGSPVIVLSRDGNKISGQLVALDALAIKVKTADQESSIPLTTVSWLSFGESALEPAQQAAASRHPDFAKDLANVLSGFQGMLGEAKTAPDYTEYGGQLVELRRRAERFINKYGQTDDTVEARAVAEVASALTDYTWARTIWALKLGRTGDVTVGRSESPTVADAVALYPEVRTAAASGDKFSVEKLIIGLWTQAGVKVERLRALTGQPR